jgi:hypothetical protein
MPRPRRLLWKLSNMDPWAWERKLAAALMVAAIVFWLWFGIGSAYVEQLGLINWVMHIVIPGGVFILSTALAWRLEGPGGTALLVEGLVALAFVTRAYLLGNFDRSAWFLMCLTLGLPPLAAGVLFLRHCRGGAGTGRGVDRNRRETAG